MGHRQQQTARLRDIVANIRAHLDAFELSLTEYERHGIVIGVETAQSIASAVVRLAWHASELYYKERARAAQDRTDLGGAMPRDDGLLRGEAGPARHPLEF